MRRFCHIAAVTVAKKQHAFVFSLQCGDPSPLFPQRHSRFGPDVFPFRRRKMDQFSSAGSHPGLISGRSKNMKHPGDTPRESISAGAAGHEIMLDIQHSLVYPLAVIVTGAEVFRSRRKRRFFLKKRSSAGKAPSRFPRRGGSGSKGLARRFREKADAFQNGRRQRRPSRISCPAGATGGGRFGGQDG